jgi:SAM-dependent methyltransferase
MRKSENRNRTFFDHASSYYQGLIRKRSSLQWITAIVEPRMGEKVLDVGNGGIREFFSPRTSLYVSLDSSLAMLRKGMDRNGQQVSGDATCLPFKGGIFDTVFYRSLLHHLAGSNGEEMTEGVREALRQGLNCLKQEGNVVIIEPCLPAFLERVEKILFFLLRAFFFLTGQSRVFLFSAGSLVESLREGGYQEIKTWKVPAERGKGAWIAPFIGLPFLKIPRGLNPARRFIFEGKKR